MMTTDIHALVGAYALDAVDDLERAAFDRHLTDCESCRTEVAELREAAARLADGAWSVPPPRMRTEVLAAIGRTRQHTSLEPARRERPVRWRRWTAAAAAVVLAGGSGATAWTIQDQRVRDQQALAEAAQQREARAQSILAAPDVVFRTAPMIGGGKVTVATSALRNAGVVLMGASAAPSDGRVFELWKIRGEAVSSTGSLGAGQATVTQVIDGLRASDAFGVTVEPPGGSPRPTFPLTAQVLPV